MPSLSQAIAAIVAQRNNKAEDFKSRQEKYKQISDRVEQIVSAINSINSDNEDVISLLTPEFIDAVKKIDPTAFNQKYQELNGLIEEVSDRYKRSEINISVVGLARQGKSTLLQSISGLDNSIIPAFSTSDCTGAVSVIRNVEGSGISAKVYFYSKAQMVEIVNKYIDAIGNQVINHIHSFNDIPKIEIAKLETFIASKKDEDKGKLQQLKSYIDKFEIWKGLVERFDGSDSCLQLENQNEIIKYVAQYNGKLPGDPEREEYYYYLAVKKVEISCSFNYKDAGKIVLRDTIGLGDDKMIGLTDSMLASIADDCDAAVVVKRPRDATDNMREYDMNLYKVLKKSCETRGLDMNKWFFFVINKTTGANGTANNSAICSTVKEQIDQLSHAGAFIADASDVNDVTENVVVPMLTKLKENLPALDKILEEQVEEKAKEVYNEYAILYNQCKKARALLNVNGTWMQNEGFDTDDILSGAISSLNVMVNDYKDIRDLPCLELKDKVDAIRPCIGRPCDLIPTVSEIQGIINSGLINSSPNVLMTIYMNKLRNDFTKEFVKMDDVIGRLVSEMQARIVKILSKEMRFDKLVGKTPADVLDILVEEEYQDQMAKGNEDITRPEIRQMLSGKEYSRWLNMARAELSSNSNFRGEMFDDIYTALDFMAGFTLSVRGFLLYKVRDSVNLLDPDLHATPVLMATQIAQQRPNGVATVIHDALVDIYRRAYEAIAGRVQPLYSEPNQALYSAIVEFKDRMFRSYTKSTREDRTSLKSVQDAWRQIYSAGCAIFQKEKYNAYQIAIKLQTLFIEMTAVDLNPKDFFTM